MTTHPMHLFDSGLKGLTEKPTRPVRLAPTTQNDVFLKALLEAGTTRTVRRSPLEWAAATGLHIVIFVAPIIVPFHTTQPPQPPSYNTTPSAPPPPPPPP